MKTYTEKEKALADWDNQHDDNRGPHEMRETEVTNIKPKVLGKELRAFLEEVDGKGFVTVVELPQPMAVANWMLLAILETISLQENESFEDIFTRMLEMKASDVLKM